MSFKYKFWQENKEGFTLLELLIVVGLIGLLSLVGLASYSNAQRASRDGKRQTDLEQLRTALEFYRSDSGNYPNSAAGSTEAGLKSDLTSPVPYISTNNFPADPQSDLGAFYYYRRVTASTYNLCALFENAVDSSDACPVSTYDCSSVGGTQNCNYGTTQP